MRLNPLAEAELCGEGLEPISVGSTMENALDFEQGRQNSFSKSPSNPKPGTGAPAQKRPPPTM